MVKQRVINWLKSHRLTSLFVVLSALLWVLVSFIYLRTPWKYESQWALILPGSGNGHAVSLDSIGQASASNASPFGGSSSLSPGANYKAIALSPVVLEAAATQLDISPADLGSPTVKLVDQTSLIQFKISALSPENAQNKADALYSAFQQQLNKLRADEQLRLEGALLNTLEGYGDKLKTAQQQKLAYQTASEIVSFDQFQQLVENLEKDRAEMIKTQVEATAVFSQMKSMMSALGVTEQQIFAAVNLRNDQLIQTYIKRHADLHTQIATVSPSWGVNHPKRQKLEAAHHEVEHQILKRGRKLAQDPKLNVWTMIEIGTSQFENNMLVELIELQATHAKLSSEVSGRQAAILALETKINQNIPNVSALEELNRRQQVATAVFTTALAKQDIGKADPFSSYPLVQLLTAPTKPLEPKTLKHNLLLVGGFFANLLTGIGLLFIWYRQRLNRRTQKNP